MQQTSKQSTRSYFRSEKSSSKVATFPRFRFSWRCPKAALDKPDCAFCWASQKWKLKLSQPKSEISGRESSGFVAGDRRRLFGFVILDPTSCQREISAIPKSATSKFPALGVPRDRQKSGGPVRYISVLRNSRFGGARSKGHWASGVWQGLVPQADSTLCQVAPSGRPATRLALPRWLSAPLSANAPRVRRSKAPSAA